MFVRVASGYFLQDLLQLACTSNRNLVFLLRLIKSPLITSHHAKVFWRQSSDRICNQCDIKFYSVSDTFKISSSTQSVYRPCCSNLFLKRIRLCTTRRVSSLLKYRYLFSFFNITISPPLSIAYKKNGCLTTVRFNLIG